MTPEELMESFTERTGIKVLRATKEGILRETTLDVDAPEIIGAMIATIFGAADTTIGEFNLEVPEIISIKKDDVRIFILPSRENILAAFAPPEIDVNEEELKSLAEAF